MTVLALVTDLLFQSKIEVAAHNVDVDVHVTRDPEQLLSLIGQARAVIVDLSVDATDAVELVQTIKQRQPEMMVVGFLPHVQTDRRKAALAAGADEVMPRSAFASRLPDLLTRLAS